MTQESLFGETVEHPTEKPVGMGPIKHRVLITVKAAPNPSVTYGETVCVAGIRLADTGPKDWIRLYPINFRHLPEASARFRKYDIVTVEARPAGEARLESWRPNMATLQVETHLPPWRKRRQLVDPMIGGSMCRIRTDAAADPRARSLAGPARRDPRLPARAPPRLEQGLVSSRLHAERAPIASAAGNWTLTLRS